MLKQFRNIILTLVTISNIQLFAQDRNKTNDTLNTQVINVVKPYEPTILDAFKIKEIPSLNNEDISSKKEINYTIFSIPVASTFTPAKGKASKVTKPVKEKLYNNYASLAVGTYTTALGSLFLNYPIERTQSIGGFLSHHSSQGDIDNVLLDNFFYDTKLGINYNKEDKDHSLLIEAGGRHQVYNWYGLSDLYATNSAFANTLEVDHSYYEAFVGGDVKFNESLINSGDLKYLYFGDSENSNEHRVTAQIGGLVPINKEEIKATLDIDYLKGDFLRDYNNLNAINYSNFMLNLSPYYQLVQEDLTVNLGFKFAYLNDLEISEHHFFVYPNLSATYNLVNEVLLVYGSISGGLLQNTYNNFTSENPFLSPTLSISPTDQKYNANIGLKGKLSKTMSYNIKGNYIAENNKALFQNNITSTDTSETDSYKFGNSFNVVYDNVSTFSFLGELQIAINRSFDLTLKGNYLLYDLKTQEEAWNLPNFEASLRSNFKINSKWFSSVEMFYVGERFDLIQTGGGLINTTFKNTLDSYIDINALVGYTINERFSVYAKANNITNQNYQRWQNFRVQGIQFLAGLTYKFDF